MPYINSKDGRRKALQGGDIARTAGELNYQLFYFIKHFSNIGRVNFEGVMRKFVSNFLGDKPNYQRYNDMTGCLVRCYKEVERRLEIDETLLIKIIEEYDEEINIYEEKKILENEDVE